MRPSQSLMWLVLLLVCVPRFAGAVGDDAAKKRDRARSHLIEARRLASGYKFPKAAEKARDALNDDPKLAEAHVYLGVDRLRASDLQGAESEFLRALELDPYQAAAHCQLGYVFYQRGELESAADHWTLSARLDTTSPQTFAGLALTQFKHGQVDEAVRTYDKALMYDHRFADTKFLASESGPKWSGPLLEDIQKLLEEVTKNAHP